MSCIIAAHPASKNKFMVMLLTAQKIFYCNQNQIVGLKKNNKKNTKNIWKRFSQIKWQPEISDFQ